MKTPKKHQLGPFGPLKKPGLNSKHQTQ